MKKKSLARTVSESAWFRLFLLAAVTLTCYTQALKAEYIWDDDDYVTQNPFLRTAGGLQQIWFKVGATPQYYPMTFTAFWVFYQLWGLNPFGYHLATVLIHILTAWMVWAVLRQLNVKGAYWAALVFAIHPVQVESVAWISELKNTLSGFFFLLALFVYFQLYRKKWSLSWNFRTYACAAGVYLLALLSKTVTCVFPVVVLIILWWKKKTVEKKDILLTVPFFAAGLVMGLVTIWMEKHHVGALGSEWDQTFIERCLIAGRVLWFYLSKLVLPVRLIFTYPRWEIDAGVWWQYLYPAAFLAFLAGLWAMKDRWGRGMLVGVVYFVLSLFPALGFFNLFPMRFSYVADHFQYLASIGPIAIAVSLMAFFWEKQPLKNQRTLALVFGVILCWFCWLTWRHTFPYKNSMTLFSDVIEKNPASWMAYNNRGHIYFSEGQFDLAEKDFEQALRLKPNYAEAWNNYGLVLIMRKQFYEAATFFSRAIELNDRYVPAYANRGAAYRELGMYDQALEDLDYALELNPYYAEGYNRRGGLFAVQQKHQQALEDFNALLKMNPALSFGYVNRARVFMNMGDYYSALMDLNRALELEPGMARAYAARAEVLDRFGETDRAQEDRARARWLGWDAPSPAEQQP
jgi:protein O-mannosyl-transferase